MKVHILDKCPHCNGRAMLPVGEGKDYKGRTYTRYAPCPDCDGSGNTARWVSLEEFAGLLRHGAAREGIAATMAKRAPAWSTPLPDLPDFT